MICEKCNTEMPLREGKFGKFYFCPNQHVCKTKTITYKERSFNYSENEDIDDGYNMWLFNKKIDYLIPSYTDSELEGMYIDSERAYENGTYNDWEDVYIGH